MAFSLVNTQCYTKGTAVFSNLCAGTWKGMKATVPKNRKIKFSELRSLTEAVSCVLMVRTINLGSKGKLGPGLALTSSKRDQMPSWELLFTQYKLYFLTQICRPPLRAVVCRWNSTTYRRSNSVTMCSELVNASALTVGLSCGHVSGFMLQMWGSCAHWGSSKDKLNDKIVKLKCDFSPLWDFLHAHPTVLQSKSTEVTSEYPSTSWVWKPSPTHTFPRAQFLTVQVVLETDESSSHIRSICRTPLCYFYSPEPRGGSNIHQWDIWCVLL